MEDLHVAVKNALRMGAVGLDAIKHLVLCQVEKRPPKLDLDVYPYLPRANVGTTVNRRSNGTPFGVSASNRDPLRCWDWGGATIRDERCLSGLRCGAGAARQEAQAGQDRCFGSGRRRRVCQLRFLNRQLSLPVSTMSQ